MRSGNEVDWGGFDFGEAQSSERHTHVISIKKCSLIMFRSWSQTQGSKAMSRLAFQASKPSPNVMTYSPDCNAIFTQRFLPLLSLASSYTSIVG